MMNTMYRNTAVLIAFATLGLACTGAQKVEQVQTRPELVDAGTLVERYARWLPKDALGVGVFAVDATVGYVASRQVRDSDPQRGERIEARKSALRADISRFTSERFGVDLMGAHTVVVGLSPTVQSVVLLGVKPTAEDTIDISGVKTFPFVPRHATDKALLERAPFKPWAAALPDGQGVVILFNRPQLNAIARSEGASLAASDTLGTYVEAMNRFPSRVAFATSVEGPLDALVAKVDAELGFTTPRFGAFILGDEMTVLLRGDDEDLERLDEVRQEAMESGAEEVQERYNARAEADSASAFGATFAYHSLLGFDEAVVVTLADGELTYSAPGDIGLYWVAGGLSSAILLPAYLRAIQKSKAAESEWMMRKLTDGGRSYFYSEQKYEPGQPWHTAGQAGWPVEWDNYVFPGGTSFTFQTSEAIPSGGETVMPEIPDDPFVQAALNKLGVDFSDPLAFRYTITTGPGTGIDATLVITAEADFEPGGPVHTVTQELYLHKQDQEVIITPPTTTNEFD